MAYRVLCRDLQVARQVYIDAYSRALGSEDTYGYDWIVSAFWHIPAVKGRRNVAVDWFCWAFQDKGVIETLDELISIVAYMAYVNGEI